MKCALEVDLFHHVICRKHCGGKFEVFFHMDEDESEKREDRGVKENAFNNRHHHHQPSTEIHELRVKKKCIKRIRMFDS